MGFLGRFRSSPPNVTSSPYQLERTSQDPVLPQTSNSNISAQVPSTPREGVPQESVPRSGHDPLANETVHVASEKSPIQNPNDSALPHPPQEAYARNSDPWANRPVDEEMGNVGNSGNPGVGATAEGDVASPRTTEGNARRPTILGRTIDRIFKFRLDDPYGPRPGFKTYLKMYWSDWLTLVLLAMFALGLLLWSPLPRNKYFAVTVNAENNEVVYPQFAYPYQKQHVSIGYDAVISILTPIVVALIINLSTVRSFWDMNAVVLGVAYSVMTACMVQIIIKIVWVGLRPYFLSVCKPQIPPVKQSDASNSPSGVGFTNMYFTVDVCTEQDSKKLAWAMQSFPSGHSAAAWAGLLYLSLYINGKLKPFANYHAAWWKLLAFVAPQVAAVLICGSLTLDNSHNWYDILVGALIGVAMAFCAYRMTFASIWDWRWNHVPLPRGNVLTYCDTDGDWKYNKRGGEGLVYSMAELDRWEAFVATRRGGWRPGQMGVERRQVWRGAPGDMTATGILASSAASAEFGIAGARSPRMGSNGNLDGGLRNPDSTRNQNYNEGGS